MGFSSNSSLNRQKTYNIKKVKSNYDFQVNSKSGQKYRLDDIPEVNEEVVKPGNKPLSHKVVEGQNEKGILHH